MNMPLRRSTDSRWPRLTAFKVWWASGWGLLVQAIWLFLVTGVVVVAVVSYALDQRSAAKAAHTSCERTQQFGPSLARAYAKYHILSEAELEQYRQTIPTRCP